MALRWESDLAGGVIHVQRGWDAKEGEISTKAATGAAPIPPRCATTWWSTRLRPRRAADQLVLAHGSDPFHPGTATKRADAAEAADLERITLHDCRHA